MRAALPADTVSDLDPGTSVLVTGPPYGWTDGFALDVIAAGAHEEGLLLVTTKDRAADWIERLEPRMPALDRDRIGVVDCGGGEDRSTIREVATQHVSSPGDLTGISIGASKLLRRFDDRDIEPVRHGLVSVSTLLQYLDLETVFKFLHVYTRRIDDTDGFGVFTLQEGVHEPRTVNTITGECDVVIELRETEDGQRELRVRGIDTAQRGWLPLDG